MHLTAFIGLKAWAFLFVSLCLQRFYYSCEPFSEMTQRDQFILHASQVMNVQTGWFWELVNEDLSGGLICRSLLDFTQRVINTRDSSGWAAIVKQIAPSHQRRNHWCVLMQRGKGEGGIRVGGENGGDGEDICETTDYLKVLRLRSICHSWREH